MQCVNCKYYTPPSYDTWYHPGEPDECGKVWEKYNKTTSTDTEVINMLEDLAFSLAKLHSCPWYEKKR